MHWEITSSALILSSTTIIVAATTWLIWRRRGDTPDEALERVDPLLYQVKTQGKNRIVRDDGLKIQGGVEFV